MEKSLTELERIGHRIRDIRNKKGINQAELAERAQLSTPVISDIELGKNNMKIDTFKRIIEALQVSADMVLRPNVPATNNVCSQEISELLSDCSAAELESLVKILKEIKETMRKPTND